MLPTALCIVTSFHSGCWEHELLWALCVFQKLFGLLLSWAFLQPCEISAHKFMGECQVFGGALCTLSECAYGMPSHPVLCRVSARHLRPGTICPSSTPCGCSSSLVCILGAAFHQEAGEVIEFPCLPSRRAHRSAPPVTQYLQRLFCVFSLVSNCLGEA